MSSNESQHHLERTVDSNGRPIPLRQQIRQRRELDELRKVGLAPLAKDAVTGEEISPNVPASIVQAPWYLGINGPTLQHQRLTSQEDQTSINDVVDRVVVVGKQDRFIPGACTNCGSLTHKLAECVEPRRRQKAAAVSGNVTGIDCIVTRAEGGSYHQKRDRWAGLTSAQDLWEQFDSSDAKSATKGPRVESRSSSGGNGVGVSGDLFASKAGDSVSTAIKPLPRYLEGGVNNGTFYDPVTRSMRGNPVEGVGSIDTTFRGDNARLHGDDGCRGVLEIQRRFLTGASKCFDDMEFDEKEAAASHAAAAGGAAAPLGGTADGGVALLQSVASADVALDEAALHQRRLAAALYGDADEATSSDANMMGVNVVSLKRSQTPREGSATTSDVNTSPLSPLQLQLATSVLPSSASVGETVVEGNVWAANSHRCAFGSYFDRSCLRWGYACCKSLERLSTCTNSPL